MRFLYALLVCLAPLTLAQNLPNSFEIPAGGFPTVTAGQPITLNWDNLSGSTVTLMLRNGNPGALNAGTTIANNIANTGTFTYTPPADTPAGTDYTFEIINEQDPSETNYTPQFTLISSVTAVPSSASASSTASASATSTVTMTVTSTGSMTTVTTTVTSGTSTGSKTSTGSSTGTTTMAATTTTAAAKGNAAPKQVMGAGMGLLALAAVVVAVL